MSYTNTNNPRRMIWFNQNAPKNKTDLWLSYNKHYEDTSDDETTEPREIVDNSNQRNCDLVLKAWDCGQWIPIVGFNTTAANKMNIVKNSPSYMGRDGILHTDFQEYHLPLFRNPSDSPDELFDAGTVGNVLLQYVSEEDWESILEGGLGDLIEQYYTENPFNLRPAGLEYLGGIWADRFGSDHNSQGNQNVHSPLSTDKPWIAQCKYKYNDSNNYNLYVHAKDIISIVNNYQEDNPSTPTLNIPWATTENCGGILSDIHNPQTQEAFKAIEAKFYPTGWQYYSELQHRLCVSAKDVIDKIEEYFLDNPGVHPPVIPYDPGNITEALEGILKNTSSIGRSIIHTSSNPNAVEFQIYNVHKSNAGKYLRLKQASEWPENEPELWNLLNCLVEWVSLENLFDELPVYAGEGVDIAKYYRQDPSTGLDKLEYRYTLNGYPEKDGLFPRSTTLDIPNIYGDTKGLEWVNLSLDMMSDIYFQNNISNGDVLIYNNGHWTNGLSSGSGTVYSVFDVDLNGLVPGPSSSSTRLFLRADGEWAVTPDTNTTYNVFTGATSSSNGSTGLVPTPSSGQLNSVLTGSRDWKPANKVFNIDIDSTTITSSTGNFKLDGYTLTKDVSGVETTLKTLEPWNYYTIQCNKNNTLFTFQNNSRIDNGNPIYIRFETDAQVEILGDIEYINSNDVFVTGTTLSSSSVYLFTIQFGILKIEKVLSIISNNDSGDNELSTGGGQ